MRRNIVLFLIFFTACVIAFIFIQIDNNKEIIESEDKEKTESEKKLESLTLDQKIGQMFMIGIEGKTITLETERMIKELHPGAILLLGKNIGTPEELKKLINSLQEIAIEDAGLPLFIAVDQEGGVVSRISWIEKTPQPEIKTEDQAYDIGKKKGEELKELGINLNLAPLLDTVSKNDFIFNRGFEKNNGVLGNKIVQGQRDAGILSCIKHFPGYGGISIHPEDNLVYSEKLPVFSQFKEVESPDMIMVSDVVYGGETLPFTFLSSGINLLKENIPGSYIIVSDDLSQYSLLNNFSLKEIVSNPINAGIDLLIFSGHRSSVKEGVFEAVKSAEKGGIKKDRINESVLKIIELKQKYFNLI